MDIRIDMQSDIEALQREIEQKVHNDVVKVLTRRTVITVNDVRDRTAEDSWEDQSGNLRSSIGGKVMVDGDEVASLGFTPVNGGTQGAAEGKDYVESVASTFHEKYVSVVGAGMDYAGYVEAMENKDVLASSTLKAKAGLAKDLARLSKKQYLK